jgi:hypothetical protein
MKILLNRWDNIHSLYMQECTLKIFPNKTTFCAMFFVKKIWVSITYSWAKVKQFQSALLVVKASFWGALKKIRIKKKDAMEKN